MNGNPSLHHLMRRRLPRLSENSTSASRRKSWRPWTLKKPRTFSRKWTRTRLRTSSIGLTPESSRDVLSEMPGEEAREVRELLKFDENSAGGMMNTDFIYVGQAATREEVVAWINEKDVDLEQLDTDVSDRYGRESSPAPLPWAVCCSLRQGNRWTP